MLLKSGRESNLHLHYRVPVSQKLPPAEIIIRAGTPLLGGQAETVGAVQPGEEKAEGTPYHGLPVLKGGL